MLNNNTVSRKIKIKPKRCHMSYKSDQLANDQLASFDQEYTTNERWERVKLCIDHDFNDGNFSFVDVGGGNGLFADRVLANYPQSQGTVLDSSELLLSKNTKNTRKKIIRADALDLVNFGNYDIIFCNWVLHHLVKTGSYTQTTKNLEIFFDSSRKVLSSRGRLSIFEIDYNGFIDDLPGKSIFHLTSSKFIAPLTSKLGANTAGVGVCFRSHNEWVRKIEKSGYKILSYTQDSEDTPLSLMKKYLLFIKKVTGGHYWLA